MGLFAASAMAHHGHHHGAFPHAPPMAHAMHAIEQTCAVDVDTLCSSTPLVRPDDPVLDWFLSPISTNGESPPMISRDLDDLITSLMDSALILSQDQPSFLMIVDEVPPPRPPMRIKEPSEEVFESMLFKLSEQVAASGDAEEEEPSVLPVLASDPIEFSKSLIKFGNDMLNEEQDEDRRRLARRLTEVSPETFSSGHHHRPRLPFGCPKNRCLMRAYEQGAVSRPCAQSLLRFEEIASGSHAAAHHSLAMEHEEETFFGLALLYGVLCLLTLMLLHRRFRKHGRKMRGSRRLKRRILQSVYSNPSIKAAIEADLNEPLGHIPPLPPHVLAQMNPKGDNNWKKQWRMRKCFKIVALVGILVLAVVNPFLAMPVLCIFAATRLISMACCPPKMPPQSCSCCCCGVSTDDVAQGNITAEQSCCCCCSGNGVCGPSCASCCGSSPNDNCCEKKKDEKEVFAGIPIQIV